MSVRTHGNRRANGANVMECDNSLEEIKKRIASFCMREVCDWRCSGPRDDGGEEDSNENRSADLIKHKKSCEDPERRSVQHA